MEEQIQIVRQGVITLPFLDDEVPVLYTIDEKPYLPVCQALELPVDPHIRKWKNMLLWTTACKLPLKTKRGTRMVWCLLISEIPFLYANVIWKYVAHERRAQLYAAIKKGVKLAHQAYQQMQKDYHEFRQLLFTFLRFCAQMEPQWEQDRQALLSEVPADRRQLFETLFDEGQDHYQEAASIARAILQEQGTEPILDALVVGEENTVVDTFSMPLLPVVDPEKRNQFLASLTIIEHWHQAMTRFFQT